MGQVPKLAAKGKERQCLGPASNQWHVLVLWEATKTLAQTLGTWASWSSQEFQSGLLTEAGRKQAPRKKASPQEARILI